MVRFFKGLSCHDIFNLFGAWFPGRKSIMSSWASYLRHLFCSPAEVKLVPNISWKVTRLSIVRRNLDDCMPRGPSKKHHVGDVPRSLDLSLSLVSGLELIVHMETDP